MNAGAVSEGEYIVQADSDEYQAGSFVPSADYEAEEQDWQHVVKVGGHADIGWMDLAYYNGEIHREHGDWSQLVWREVDDKGQPVWQDPQDRD